MGRRKNNVKKKNNNGFKLILVLIIILFWGVFLNKVIENDNKLNIDIYPKDNKEIKVYKEEENKKVDKKEEVKLDKKEEIKVNKNENKVEKDKPTYINGILIANKTYPLPKDYNPRATKRSKRCF